MNTKRVMLFLVLGAVGLCSTAPAQTPMEPVGVEVTVEPQIPARLRMEGLRDGKVTFAVDVDAEGKLVDWLVLEASHHDLVGPCVEAVQRWRFTPARYEGARVPARAKFTLNISQTGAVVSRNTVEMINEFMENLAGRPLDYRICRPGELDRPLEAVTRVSPQYGRDAERQGVGGRVMVYFFVDEQGNVRLPAVPAETHPYLSGIAVRAMRDWKFTPPTREGRPVAVEARQAFVFGAAGK